MKLLYVASDQRVPGRTGGSVHVDEVARGLAARGHEVHVLALAGERRANGAVRPYELHPSRLPFEHRFFRWSAKRAVGELVDRLRIEAVMERYYNFGGEGIRAAHARGIPSLLEVNSPLKDHPGSLKSLLDRALLLRPLKRVRDEICRKTSALVTPLPAIVPEEVPLAKVHRVQWGANVERFRPDVAKRRLAIPEKRKVVVFSGSFRPWHGADVLVRAAARILTLQPEAFFLFLGSGPTWEETRALAVKLGIAGDVLFTGGVAYEEMPAYLRAAQIGVAPYQPSRLGQMKLGFYWSPLKIFEYMAMALPVVSLDVPPLAEIVRPGREGLLFAERDEESFSAAVSELLADPARAQAMGEAGRDRVVAHFSWQRHCEELETILEGLVKAR
ncbi:MAG: glycosyltransferase family 4 protein [Vicinamibacteria bacterium]